MTRIERDLPAALPGVLPSANGSITRLAYARAQEEGIDVGPLVRKAALTVQQIDDPDVRLNVQSQIRFLELASEALHDDLLGFHLAQSFDLRSVGLLYYVLASSDMLEEALRHAVRYSRIVNDGISLTLRDGPDVGIVFNYVGVPRRLDRHQIEFWVTALVRICRQLADRRLPIVRVSLTHTRSNDLSEFSAFFGGEVRFGADVDEVVFARTIRHTAITGADSYLHGLLIKYCEEALSGRATNRGPFGSSVENAIALLLPHGKARAGEVARKLGVSQRTLARRLAAEGLTFAGVLQDTRADLARRHLTDEALSISKIAWLLGYQDVSAFTHAFKRWTGQAPRAARPRKP